MYTDSLVVFLDILGLTDTINENKDNQVAVESIANTLHKIQKMASFMEIGARESWKTEFKGYAFSDSIVISCPEISEKSLIYAGHIIAAIQWEIMRDLYYIRGAITAGPHYEKEHVFFGPAFIAAYELEKLCSWPRVIVDTSVLKRLKKHDVEEAPLPYLLQDEYGLYYFHYLHFIYVLYLLELEQKIKENKSISSDATDKLKQHKQCLIKSVEKVIARGRYDLLSKYHAVAKYHNQYIDELYKGLPRTDDYEKVDLNTTLGKLLNNFKVFAPSRQGLEMGEIEMYLESWTKALYQLREPLKACKINLIETFTPLYPHMI